MHYELDHSCPCPLGQIPDCSQHSQHIKLSPSSSQLDQSLSFSQINPTPNTSLLCPLYNKAVLLVQTKTIQSISTQTKHTSLCFSMIYLALGFFLGVKRIGRRLLYGSGFHAAQRSSAWSLALPLAGASRQNATDRTV